MPAGFVYPRVVHEQERNEQEGARREIEGLNESVRGRLQEDAAPSRRLREGLMQRASLVDLLVQARSFIGTDEAVAGDCLAGRDPLVRGDRTGPLYAGTFG